MIATKNRMPHVQSRMINMQHIAEAEATPDMTVALTRIPPGAVVLSGSLEVVEAHSAGTMAIRLVDNSGVEIAALLAATSVASIAAPVAYTGGQVRAPAGGWIVADCAGGDVASLVGDAVAATEYVVDGRHTEVMPEAGVVMDDVTT